MSLTVQAFMKQFPSDEVCLEHLFNTRFGQGYVCPKCHKSTKWYPLKSERAYSCEWCGHHIHPTVGTPFESSRTSLQSWFFAMYLFSVTRHGVSAKELERQLGVTYKTAWRMGHQIRKHMAEVDGNSPLSGIIEVDETYLGGKREGRRGRGAAGKTVIFGMLERAGRIVTKIVPDAKRKTLLPHIIQNSEAGSEIHSDEWPAYRGIDKMGYSHKKVEHGSKQYAADGIHVNSLEGYWSIFKRSIRSTHIHVSAKHVEKYMREFEFRFNRRKSPASMFPALISSFRQP